MSLKHLTEASETPGVKVRLATLAKAQKELTAEMRKVGAKAFKAEVKEIFAAHPELEAFRWTQYTPHFNDGSPCEFGIHDIYFRLVGDPAPTEDSDDECDGEDESSFPHGTYAYSKTPVQTALRELESAMGGVKDAMRSAFGDGVRVTCWTDGRVEVEEYEHY